MSLTEEALSFLTNNGIEPESRVVFIEEIPYVIDSEGTAHRVDPVAYTAKQSLNLNTLSSLVDYIKSELDRKDDRLILTVKDEQTVFLEGQLEVNGSRERLAEVNAIVPAFNFDYFYNSEEFNIKLQSIFTDSSDREILLKVVGNISEDSVKTVGDDGVSQAVTINQGVASKVDVKVPNPVTLAPYRTFNEVKQPESKFVFRMKEGPRCALFEADGGIWRNKAIQNIKEYFEKALQAEIQSGKITILA
ncbi:hypothetical protein [uncultured Ligilactobacillus sp.]|uniref:hypothetical protein n=1 Tax=uncultured Ligilactobacillus sp. TaxID=2837633 RepID=UPI00272BA3E7|nr:hypothetical protein [uncultured Ligilactobacillus sp.]